DFRPGSNARVTTVGFAGLVIHQGVTYGPLTGSSVATASLSGIAALLWSYFPTLTPDELMQAIYDGGTTRMIDDVPVIAGVYLGQTAPEQRMVTACGTIASACMNLAGLPDPAQCQLAIDNCEISYGTSGIDVDTSAWQMSFTAAFDQLSDADKASESAPEMAVYECERCGLDTVSKLPTDESIPAEAMGDPWVLPQPTTPPCPMCMLDDD